MGFLRDKVLDDILGINPGSTTPQAIKDLDTDATKVGFVLGGPLGAAIGAAEASPEVGFALGGPAGALAGATAEGFDLGDLGLGDFGLNQEATQTITQLPPQFQIPFILDALQRAQGFINQPDVTQQQQQQFGGFLGDIGASRQGLLGTARGENLLSNPFLEKQFNRGADLLGQRFNEIVRPGIDAQFARAGRLNSPASDLAHQRAEEGLGRTLSGFATDLFGGQFGRERALQQQAQQALPGLGAQAFDAANIFSNIPLNRLSAFSNLVNRQMGQTTSQPLFRNQAAGILGGALAGAGIGSAFGPIGPAIGAIGGGLLGGL